MGTTPMPLISVITPFLNVERFLPDAIESVRAQTFTDWEMLLIDDGSSDGSAAIAEAAATGDPRIRFIRSNGQRRGAAAARNAGIAAASGMFFTFLDGDDIFEPEKFETELAIFDAHPRAKVLYGPTLWWFPDEPHRNWTDSMPRQSGRLHMPPDLLDQVIVRQRAHVPCICSIMVHREALVAVGGFDEAFELYEDQTLLVKLLLRYPVFVTSTPTGRYRQHLDSTSAKATASGIYDRLRPHAARIGFLEWVEMHASASGLMTPELQRALRFAFARYPAQRRPLTLRDRFDLAIEAGRRFARRLTPRRTLSKVFKLLTRARK
ncbi:MAG: glycosyltransferase [Mesorhizobium sp.]|nr:MAG: glycosyltransferase [Mesorhizobium sp.]RWE84855.1 MAG: glycosyltransferase [Mesorhizobium sp.]TIM84253.1 MAG: glycosyltransferase [Mesorhizobium sp.]